MLLDYETRSRADLKKCGAYEYARDPSTRILCVGFRCAETREGLADAETKVWSPFLGPAPELLLEWLAAHDVRLVAHNVPFERVITQYVFHRHVDGDFADRIPLDRWECSMANSRAVSLPAKLEFAAAALKLKHTKDMQGHRLMLKLSKPRKPTKTDPSPWHSKRAELIRVMQYCATDVDTEAELFLRVPPLSPSERRLWLLDQKINERGFHCDRPLVQRILEMLDRESNRLTDECARLTDGAVRSTKQVAETKRWLAAQGVELPNLQKKTVADAIAAGLASGKALELLEVRQEASKASTSKYVAFEQRSKSKGRVCDALTFHTAHTGRWGGAGLGPQNLPVPRIDNPHKACERIRDATLEDLRFWYGSPNELFASCLRSMIIASPGKEFFGGDYSGIELRVLFWLAKHEAGLRAIRSGQDMYCAQASVIYDKPITKENHFERQLGKKAVLGCGFQMGPDKFFETCWADGMEVSEEIAKKAVVAYRELHAPVVQLWKNLEQAALAAVRHPGKRYRVNRILWFVEGEYLWAELPSGRRLAYYGPSIKHKITPWGEKKATLYYWCVHPKTKKWVQEGTYGGKLTENCVQAVARDLLADALQRLEARGYEVVLHVHDEPNCEREAGTGSLAEFETLMSRTPPWAADLPVKVEGWQGERY